MLISYSTTNHYGVNTFEAIIRYSDILVALLECDVHTYLNYGTVEYDKNTIRIRLLTRFSCRFSNPCGLDSELWITIRKICREVPKIHPNTLTRLLATRERTGIQRPRK